MSKRSVCFGLVLLWVLWAGMTVAHAQFFEYLRPPGTTYLNALSGDGNSVAAGMTTTAATEPAVWSITDGWVRLFPGLSGSAKGISFDGSVVVGDVNDGAFVWRMNGTARTFPTPSSAWALDDAAARFVLWRDYAALRDVATNTDITVWPSTGTGYRYTIRPRRICRDGSTDIVSVTGSGRTDTSFIERIDVAYIPRPRYA